jgi:hypothetical protein
MPYIYLIGIIMTNLGELKKIPLRQIWPHEEYNFSEWLSQPDNISLLSDELGIEINVLEKEAYVGNFNLDLLAEEGNTNRKIIIENQMEMTNHDHLGKIITYASGYNASYVVWIFKEIREEHRHAIDWLNEHSDEETYFFGVKIELWQIGDSPVAPKFQVICKPNNWGKTIRNTSINKELTDTKLLQLEYWEKLKEYGENENSKLNFRSPRPQHWYDMSIGSSLCHLALTVNSSKKVIGVELYIDNNKNLFHHIFQYKTEIENKIGNKLEWLELAGKKASRIKLHLEADFYKKDDWENQFKWLVEYSEKFNKAFGPIIKKFRD